MKGGRKSKEEWGDGVIHYNLFAVSDQDISITYITLSNTNQSSFTEPVYYLIGGKVCQRTISASNCFIPVLL